MAYGRDDAGSVSTVAKMRAGQVAAGKAFDREVRREKPQGTQRKRKANPFFPAPSAFLLCDLRG